MTNFEKKFRELFHQIVSEMAANLMYPVLVLVDNLNKITDNVVASTEKNITNPTPIYVQTILFELLKEIGFSRCVCDTHCVCEFIYESAQCTF